MIGELPDLKSLPQARNEQLQPLMNLRRFFFELVVDKGIRMRLLLACNNREETDAVFSKMKPIIAMITLAKLNMESEDPELAEILNQLVFKRKGDFIQIEFQLNETQMEKLEDLQKVMQNFAPQK